VEYIPPEMGNYRDLEMGSYKDLEMENYKGLEPVMGDHRDLGSLPGEGFVLQIA
jgi:hypothetical protein